MFLLRSVFWLSVGFFVVAPHGTDFGVTASQMKDQAISAGTQAAEQMIVSQVFNDPVAKAVVAKLSSSSSSSKPSVALPMQDSTTPAFVFPRQRPAAMG